MNQLLRKSPSDATTVEQLAVAKYRERLFGETLELLEVVRLMAVDECLEAAADVQLALPLNAEGDSWHELFWERQVSHCLRGKFKRVVVWVGEIPDKVVSIVWQVYVDADKLLVSSRHDGREVPVLDKVLGAESAQPIMQIDLSLDHVGDKVGKGLDLLGRKTIHIVGTEEVTQVVDGEDAHRLDVAAALRPEEVVGYRGLAVEPDNTVGDEHLLTRVSTVRLVVRKVCRLEFCIRV